MSKTRDHAALEKRRKKAGRLFGKECSAPDVARRLGVARQVAYRWKDAWEQGGSQALASKGPAGPKARLTVEQTQQVTEALLAGPVAQGCKTALWTLPRVAFAHRGSDWGWCNNYLVIGFSELLDDSTATILELRWMTKLIDCGLSAR